MTVFYLVDKIIAIVMFSKFILKLGLLRIYVRLGMVVDSDCLYINKGSYSDIVKNAGWLLCDMRVSSKLTDHKRINSITSLYSDVQIMKLLILVMY